MWLTIKFVISFLKYIVIVLFSAFTFLFFNFKDYYDITLKVFIRLVDFNFNKNIRWHYWYNLCLIKLSITTINEELSCLNRVITYFPYLVQLVISTASQLFYSWAQLILMLLLLIHPSLPLRNKLLSPCNTLGILYLGILKIRSIF